MPLGQFISEYVYDGKLRSEHAVKTQSCVAFVDVSLGEEENDNKSYIVSALPRVSYCLLTFLDRRINVKCKLWNILFATITVTRTIA